MSADNVPDLGETLKAILILESAGVPSAYSGPTVWGLLKQIQRVLNERVMAHPDSGTDERADCAGRALLEAIFKAVRQESKAAEGNEQAGTASSEADALGDAPAGTTTSGPETTRASGQDLDGDTQDTRESDAHADLTEEAGRSSVTPRILSPAECVSTVLRDLWASLAADDDAAVFAAGYRVEDDPDADQAELARQRWERLHLMCLRLNCESAELWRQIAWERIAAVLQENGHEPEAIPAAETGQGAGQPEIPGLPEIGYPGTAPLGAGLELPEKLARSVQGLGERWLSLVRSAAIAYWLDEHDPQLYGGLADVHTTDRWLGPPGTRSGAYRQELIDRVRDLAREHDGDPREFSRAVSVDEAIRGLVPIPFPASGSWWTTFNNSLEETLTKQLSHQIFVPVLGMTFSSMSGNVEEQSPQVPPELVRKYRLSRGIVWVLRLGYPQHIVSSQSKARVVYVSGG